MRTKSWYSEIKAPENWTRENLAWLAWLAKGTVNWRKRACKRDHLFTEANTYVDPDGRRHCRKCRAADSKRLRAARGAA